MIYDSKVELILFPFVKILGMVLYGLNSGRSPYLASCNCRAVGSEGTMGRFGKEYKQNLVLLNALESNSPPPTPTGFSDLPTALNCSRARID